jgi:hypothetical protein
MNTGNYEDNYYYDNITALLENGFDVLDLKKACRLAHGFSRLVTKIEGFTDKTILIEVILGFATKHMLIDNLLLWAKDNNSKRYKYHAPYTKSPVISLKGQDLVGADFTGSNLSMAKLVNVVAIGMDLTGSNFSLSNFARVDLRGSDLSKAIIDQTTKLPHDLEEKIKEWVAGKMTTNEFIAFKIGNVKVKKRKLPDLNPK